MAIGTGQRQTGQGDAQLRRHDVNNALVWMIGVDQMNACILRHCASFSDESFAAWAAGLIAAAACTKRDNVIHDREHAGWIANGIRALTQRLQSHSARSLVQQQTVDSDEIITITRVADAMLIPKLIEQCLRQNGPPSVKDISFTEK